METNNTMNSAQVEAAATLVWVRDAYATEQAEYRVVMQAEDQLFALCGDMIAAANMPQGWDRSAVQRRKVADVLVRNAQA